MVCLSLFLKRHPRFHIHFIPTRSSWLNLVERWFREITDKRIRRETFQSVCQLIDAIRGYIEEHNDNPKPFIWTAKAEDTGPPYRNALVRPKNDASQENAQPVDVTRKANLLCETFVETALLWERHDFDQVPTCIG